MAIINWLLRKVGNFFLSFSRHFPVYIFCCVYLKGLYSEMGLFLLTHQVYISLPFSPFIFQTFNNFCFCIYLFFIWRVCTEKWGFSCYFLMYSIYFHWALYCYCVLLTISRYFQVYFVYNNINHYIMYVKPGKLLYFQIFSSIFCVY